METFFSILIFRMGFINGFKGDLGTINFAVIDAEAALPFHSEAVCPGGIFTPKNNGIPPAPQKTI